MSRLIQYEVFKYEELREPAKKVARDWYREAGFNYKWWDFIYEEFTALANDLSIEIEEIFFTGFYSQGDGACFTGSFDLAKVDINEAMKHQYVDEVLEKIIDDFGSCAKLSEYTCSGTIRHMGHYVHEHSNTINVEFSKELTEGHEVIIERDITIALRKLMKWLYRKLEKEYEYITSDKSVAETIIANEYEFTKDGKRSFTINSI